MISDNFTSLTLNSSFIDYVYAFDNALNHWFIFPVLLACLLVIISGIYILTNDFIAATVFGLTIISITSFFLTLIQNDAGIRLLSFNKLSIFVVLLALSVIYKKISDT